MLKILNGFHKVRVTEISCSCIHILAQDIEFHECPPKVFSGCPKWVTSSCAHMVFLALQGRLPLSLAF